MSTTGSSPPIVVAIGGHSLLDPDQPPTVANQFAVTRAAMGPIADLLERGDHLVMTHGNGPQVGFMQLRSELARDEVPEVPLDSLVADSQGAMGYMIEAALRAVQFLRNKAGEWNIDPQRIVVTGGSAGGCSSLLVALHDDVADPESSDPVQRCSSRVNGAVVAGAQTTMNPFVIKERIGEKTFGNPMPYKPFGAETIEELFDNWDKYKELVLLCSPITHLSADDPPLHLFYNVNREFPTTSGSNGIHSPIFGEIMLEACKELGVECHLQYHEADRPKPAISRQEFINKLLLK